MSEEKVIFCGNNERYLAKELIENSDDANSGSAFRIPSIINANGTLVCAVAKQKSGDNWGFIELAIRRSEDGGESWSSIESIATPPARATKSSSVSYASAFFTNPSMAIAPNGDIIMLVEFYPESWGYDNRRLVDKKKLAYSMYNKKMCPILYDKKGRFYLVTENGVVLNNKYNETSYRVTDWRGSLYYNDEYMGNIFLNGQTGEHNENTTFGAPLKRPKRNYIYMLRSSDNGKTWSEPCDITGDILIKDDGAFINVSSGVGLTTTDGKIIMPLYVSNKESIAIYSNDNAEKWSRTASQPYCCNKDEWQLVQANDEIILGLGRQKSYGKTPLSISTSKGTKWEENGDTKLFAPKCQKSIISIGDYVFCSHPSERKRENGVITIGKFTKVKGKTNNISWFSEVEINSGYFAYSCLCQIDEESIGVLYEAQPSSYICFKKYKIDDLIK